MTISREGACPRSKVRVRVQAPSLSLLESTLEAPAKLMQSKVLLVPRICFMTDEVGDQCLRMSGCIE